MTPVAHRFSYPFLMGGFFLSELAELNRTRRGFSFNSTNLLSLHEGDYFNGGSSPLSEQIVPWFADPVPSNVLLLTMPRVFNYAFNPISLFLGFEGDQLKQVVVQVNNTFGDRHIYPLTELEMEEGAYRASCKKEFHVSPFFDLDGEYRFLFRSGKEQMEIHCDYYEGEQCRLKSGFKLTAYEFTKVAAVRHALLFPFRVAMTMPRILWQAFKLHYLKKLKVYKRPEPFSASTILAKGRATSPDEPTP